MFSRARSLLRIVGRMPASTTLRPAPSALARASASSSSSWPSSALRQEPVKTCGSRLHSRLNAPTSVVKWGSPRRPSMSSAWGAGRNDASTRNISCSAPMRVMSVSKRPSASIRSRAWRSRNIQRIAVWRSVVLAAVCVPIRDRLGAPPRPAAPAAHPPQGEWPPATHRLPGESRRRGVGKFTRRNPTRELPGRRASPQGDRARDARGRPLGRTSRRRGPAGRAVGQRRVSR